MLEELRHFVTHEKNAGIDFVEKAHKHDGNIYLYGAGNNLEAAVRFMDRNQINITAILDSRQKGVYHGIPIMLFSDFLETNPLPSSWFVISAPSAAEEIANIITAHFPIESVFFFETAIYATFSPDINKYRDYLVQNWDQIISLYCSLADERSRETLELVLKGRISGIPSYFRKCYEPNQYYPKDIIHFATNEIFVELGANHGETFLEFAKLCPDYKTAYCFEPEKACYPALAEIKAEQDKRGKDFHIIAKGAWDKAGVLEFCSAADSRKEASHIVYLNSDKTGSYKIETAAVDDVIEGPVSYVKMDIEGAELHALRGMSRSIAENHPKLAICVYHQAGDLLKIWNYLKEFSPKYRFYLRHHMAYSAIETLLYAV